MVNFRKLERIMARRSKLETAIVNYLSGYGWTPPSLRVQSVAFPGCTPAATSARGRGGVVFDVERREDTSGILVAYCAGLKASATKKSTVTITTGTSHHIDSVVKAAERGLSIPVFAVSVNAMIDEEDNIRDHGPISVAYVRVGDMIRRHGIEPRTEGQGKGRGIAAAVAWGVKRQRSASGKMYEYISLQANLPACGAKWETLNALVELEGFIAARAEGIPV